MRKVWQRRRRPDNDDGVATDQEEEVDGVQKELKYDNVIEETETSDGTDGVDIEEDQEAEEDTR